MLCASHKNCGNIFCKKKAQSFPGSSNLIRTDVPVQGASCWVHFRPKFLPCRGARLTNNHFCLFFPVLSMVLRTEGPRHLTPQLISGLSLLGARHNLWLEVQLEVKGFQLRPSWQPTQVCETRLFMQPADQGFCLVPWCDYEIPNFNQIRSDFALLLSGI